jgi:hypothetical protein
MGDTCIKNFRASHNFKDLKQLEDSLELDQYT